jgi:plastocyanin
MNTSNALITVAVVALIAAGGFLLFIGNDTTEQPTQQPATTTQDATTSESGTTSNRSTSSPQDQSDEPGQEATSTDSEGSDVGTTTATEPAATVQYVDGEFTPQEVTVSQGETVRFTAESQNMWVASDVHPSHTEYDGTSLSEHCNGEGESFDQCESGREYSFTFDQSGEFNYHNHEQPSAKGTVIVQ